MLQWRAVTGRKVRRKWAASLVRGTSGDTVPRLLVLAAVSTVGRDVAKAGEGWLGTDQQRPPILTKGVLSARGRMVDRTMAPQR